MVSAYRLRIEVGMIFLPRRNQSSNDFTDSYEQFGIHFST